MVSKLKADATSSSDQLQMQWQTIATAPFDRDLQLAVIDGSGIHALVFPCRRVLRGWINARTSEPVTVWPTHWREWGDAVSPLFANPAS